MGASFLFFLRVKVEVLAPNRGPRGLTRVYPFSRKTRPPTTFIPLACPKFPLINRLVYWIPPSFSSSILPALRFPGHFFLLIFFFQEVLIRTSWRPFRSLIVSRKTFLSFNPGETLVRARFFLVPSCVSSRTPVVRAWLLVRTQVFSASRLRRVGFIALE